MRDFEEKGYANSADETAKVISAYHQIVKKKVKNNFNSDYNAAFRRIDSAIDNLANKVFYDCDKKATITLIILLKNLTTLTPSSPASA